MRAVSDSTARPRSLLALTMATIAALAVLLALAAWQLQRMDEKQGFLAALEREAKGPPRSDWAATPEFGHVTLTGEFLAGKTAFVRVTLPDGTQARKGGLGLFVMVPLRRADGTLVLVNRGFVPTGVDGKPPAVATPAGMVSITGFKRQAEPRTWFSVADDVPKLVFAVRDPSVIATALGVEADAAFLEAEAGSPSGEGPQGVDAAELLERIPNNHLQYALTWLGLGTTLIGVYLAMVLSLRRVKT